jgi:hypothetical protein
MAPKNTSGIHDNSHYGYSKKPLSRLISTQKFSWMSWEPFWGWILRFFVKYDVKSCVKGVYTS